MKIISVLTLATATLFLVKCHKPYPDDSIVHINCDGLTTDTLGTGDNARIYMPNAFTPNGDGLNDISKPYTQNVTAIAFTIYDGNNTVVFTTTTLGAGWTTTVAANTSTTYYFKIQATTAGGRHIGVCGNLYKLSCFPANIFRGDLYFSDQLTLNGFTGPTAESMGTCP